MISSALFLAWPRDVADHFCRLELSLVCPGGKKIITFLPKVGKTGLLLLDPFKWND